MASWEPDEMPDDDWALGQNEVDVRNEARKPGREPWRKSAGPTASAPSPASGDPASPSRPAHYEVSPREREDEQRRDEREFGPYVCEHPFEDWIQDILDQKRSRPG